MPVEGVLLLSLGNLLGNLPHNLLLDVSAAGATMSTGVQPPANPDPLRETSRYTKVADLSHGSFGFVQLARNTETQELVAIKFIERGDRVNRCDSSSNSSNNAAQTAARACKTSCGRRDAAIALRHRDNSSSKSLEPASFILS